MASCWTKSLFQQWSMSQFSTQSMCTYMDMRKNDKWYPKNKRYPKTGNSWSIHHTKLSFSNEYLIMDLLFTFFSIFICSEFTADDGRLIIFITLFWGTPDSFWNIKNVSCEFWHVLSIKMFVIFIGLDVNT